MCGYLVCAPSQLKPEKDFQADQSETVLRTLFNIFPHIAFHYSLPRIAFQCCFSAFFFQYTFPWRESQYCLSDVLPSSMSEEFLSLYCHTALPQIFGSQTPGVFGLLEATTRETIVCSFLNLLFVVALIYRFQFNTRRLVFHFTILDNSSC